LYNNNLKKEKKTKTTVYTAQSPLIHPIELVVNMFKDLFSATQLAWRLTTRDIKAMYRQTMFGYFWAVFAPLVTSLTFIILNQANVMQVGVITVPYPVFVISGTIFWTLFTNSLNAPLNTMAANKSLLSKINFPKEAIILSAVGQTLFTFSIKLFMLFVVMLIYSVPFNYYTLLIIVPIFGLITIGTLLGLLIAPIGMLYQDIQKGILSLISIMMFFTPVLFPTPEKGIMVRIIEINPLTPFFLSLREVLFASSITYVRESIIITMVAFLLLFMAWAIYRITIPILAERMEA